MTLALSPPVATLRETQQEALQRAEALDGRIGLFMEMGTGKTRVALSYAQQQGFARILIVGPLTALGVWSRECGILDMSAPIDLTTAGTVKQRAATLAKVENGIVLINYESYWREPLRSAIDKWQPECIILDEGHRIRHRGARHTRWAHALADKPYVRAKMLLSGTPISNGLQDAWSLFRFIDDRVFGRRWADFEREYLRMGGYQMRQIIEYRNVDRAEALIARHTYQCSKDEASLPERFDIPWPIRLDPDTRAVYDELKKKAIVDVLQAGATRTVLARTALVLLLRLQQIACGFSREVGADVFPLSHEKADATVDLVEQARETDDRVVVFCRFSHDLDKLADRLKGYRVERLEGGQSAKARREILTNFQAGLIDVLLCQIKVASLGIDLTAASVAIFYSVGFSLDDFLQAKDRLHREGQTRVVRYYHLLASQTVDVTVYAALQAKLNIAQALTSLTYAKNLLGTA